MHLPAARVTAIDTSQAALARKAFPAAAIAVKKDLASLDRAIVVET
jgi:hypothetical protein